MPLTEPLDAAEPRDAAEELAPLPELTELAGRAEQTEGAALAPPPYFDLRSDALAVPVLTELAPGFAAALVLPRRESAAPFERGAARAAEAADDVWQAPATPSPWTPQHRYGLLGLGLALLLGAGAWAWRQHEAQRGDQLVLAALNAAPAAGRREASQAPRVLAQAAPAQAAPPQVAQAQAAQAQAAQAQAVPTPAAQAPGAKGPSGDPAVPSVPLSMPPPERAVDAKADTAVAAAAAAVAAAALVPTESQALVAESKAVSTLVTPTKAQRTRRLGNAKRVAVRPLVPGSAARAPSDVSAAASAPTRAGARAALSRAQRKGANASGKAQAAAAARTTPRGAASKASAAGSAASSVSSAPRKAAASAAPVGRKKPIRSAPRRNA